MGTTLLAPLSTGELLDRTLSLYRRHFVLFVGIMVIPNLFMVLTGIAGALAGQASPLLTPLVMLVGIYAFLVAYACAWAATVFAVSEVQLGRPTSVRQAYARIRGKLFRMIWAMFLVGLAVAGGLVLLVIPAIIFFLRLSLTWQAAVLEDLPARTAIKRSWALTKGSMGRIALVYILAIILSWVAAAVFQFPLQALAAAQQAPIWLTVINQIGAGIGSALAAPIGTIGLSLVYYDARVRKEAFDLQLLIAALDQAPVAAPAAGAAASGN